jgi:LysR family transcriptional activator of dmlA
MIKSYFFNKLLSKFITMSLDLISCMKGFLAVAEHQGFSQASRHTLVSTPILTNQLQRLEQLLKKPLLHRTTRRVELTEAGKIYLVHVKRIFAEIELAQNALTNVEKVPHGLLTVGVPTLLHSLYFIEQLKNFLQCYPKIQLKVIDEIFSGSLVDGTVDLIISGINMKDKQLIKEYLFTVQSSIYAAPEYIEKYGIPKSVEDLKNHNCLVNLRVSPNNEWIFANNKKVKVQGNYTATSGINILHACIAGLGLMWTMDMAIKEEMHNRKLVEIPLGNPAKIDIYQYYRPVSAEHIVKLMANYFKNFTSKRVIA